jgi:hypothetical protein
MTPVVGTFILIDGRYELRPYNAVGKEGYSDDEGGDNHKNLCVALGHPYIPLYPHPF